MYCHFVQDGRSLNMWSDMPGQLCSSTRTETAAVIFALGLPGRVDIRSDSAAMLSTLRGILKPNFQPKRPWGLMPNGDLWQAIHSHELSKGIDNITCAKVKGHTTVVDVIDGIVTSEDRQGNNEADRAADLGVQSKVAWLHHLCHVFQIFSNL